MTKYITLIVLFFITLSCTNTDRQNGIKPIFNNIIESVYASVKISPEISYYVQPTRAGIINKIYVEVGDQVNSGDILFNISPTEDFKNRLSNSEIDLQEAQSNYSGNSNLLNNIKLEIQTIKEQLRLDSINFKRQERLWSKNIGKKIDLDQLKLKYLTTQKQLELLNQKYDQTSINLKNNYKKARARTNTERSLIDDFTIRSEMDGIVYSLDKEEGDFISTQERFAELGSIDSFKLELDIDEVDITKIEVGDSVLIILDAYIDEVFIAKVNQIFPKKDDLTQTFRAECRFTENPPKLYYGLAGEANILVSRRNKALTIPAEYLMPNNKVLTLDGEKSVKIGLKNLEFVEILSGIDTSITLLKPSE